MTIEVKPFVQKVEIYPDRPVVRVMGNMGSPGPKGDQGDPGPKGDTGDPAQNPNYTYQINTLAYGTPATIAASGAYPNITLTFGIPEGAPGQDGQGLVDGDKGDVLVANAGTAQEVWTVQGASGDFTANGIITATGSGYFVTTGANAAISFGERDGAGSYLIFMAGGLLNFYTGGSTQITFSQAGDIAARTLKVGTETNWDGTAADAAILLKNDDAADYQFTVAANATGAYIQSWNSQPLHLNESGNPILVGTAKLDLVATLNAKKNVAPNIQSISSAATVTPDFANDAVHITGQAAALTLANWSGTAVDDWGMVIRIKDNGTSQNISYGTMYRAAGTTLPTTTGGGKTTYLGCIYNAAAGKIDVVGVQQF